MHSEFWWRGTTANSTSQFCLSNLLHLEASTLLRKISLRRKQGLPRYLSCLLYNDIHLNTFYLVARHLLWSLEAPKHDCGSEKQKWSFIYIFLWRLHTKNHRKPTFSEGIYGVLVVALGNAGYAFVSTTWSVAPLNHDFDWPKPCVGALCYWMSIQRPRSLYYNI